MKIGIYLSDALPETGGAHTFESELLQELSGLDCKHQIVVLTEGRCSSDLPVIRQKRNILHGLVNRVCLALSRPLMFDRGATLKQSGIDLIYSPNPNIPCHGIPYVVTCWDLQHRLQPFFPEVSNVRSGGMSGWDRRERHFRNLLPRASCVITGTEVGKSEVTHFYQVAPERVAVIPFFAPTKLHRCRPQKPSWLPDGRFFVYPAQFWPHKNQRNLVEALRLLHDQGFGDVRLVLPGADKAMEFGTMSKTRTLAAKLNVSESVHTPGFVSDSEMRWLYENAVSLAFVSHFGPDNLPPLEAASLGCPVVAADVNGAREQLGAAALLVDARSVASIAAALVKILTDQSTRVSLISAGRELAAKNTLGNYSERLVEIFNELESYGFCRP